MRDTDEPFDEDINKEREDRQLEPGPAADFSLFHDDDSAPSDRRRDPLRKP